MNGCRFQVDERGVAWITLDRPQQHNAFDDEMITGLIGVLESIEEDELVRLVVLSGAGKSFSSGADLNWMRRMADFDEQRNRADARQLADLMYRLNHFPRPVVARVHGAAFGGGIGLIACCDIVVASSNTIFCLAEVRLGLAPAVISPYVINKIGESASRRYMLTAERFEASDAQRMGLVHEIVAESELDARVERLLEDLLRGGTCAQAATKQLLLEVGGVPLGDKVIEQTVSCISTLRASEEGIEGLNAFLHKRRPRWFEDE